jgi:hypothetical protein
MDTIKEQKDDIIFHAERLLHYNNLLIKQCDSWLPAEEGNRNMETQIMERRKQEKEIKKPPSFWQRILRIEN